MSEQKKPIVVRMAPSPTGNLHVGGARTTLYNYLFAKHTRGKFILRIEDTDKERSTPEFEKNILDSLSWLGLSYDELFRQSERTNIYVGYVKKMLENGSAYISKEEPKEVGQRSEVIRFKNPNKKIAFEDMIRGTVEFDTTDLEDFVIARSIEEPLYHLAVVVDDFEMGVTHVIRGEEHLSNTPRQILIQEAIGAPRPMYAHIPLILDSDRKKLSKRKHGEAVWIDTYEKEGYLPQALLNYFTFLGWNPGGEREVYTLAELGEVFNIEKVQKGGAIFDIEKLKWFNKEHMRMLPEIEIKTEIKARVLASKRLAENNWKLSDEVFERSWKLLFERISTWKGVTEIIDSGEFDFLFEQPPMTKQLLIGKSNAVLVPKHLEEVKKLLETLDENHFTKESIRSAVWPYASDAGRGEVLWPMRVALSGKEKSPDPFTLAEIVGKPETLSRLAVAVRMLGGDSQDGFIMTILLIVIALVIAQNIFHLNITGFISSSVFGNFVRDIWTMLVAIWNAIKHALTSTS